MAEQVPFGGTNVEFVENPEPRVPCVLVLDTSGSMAGAPIDEVNTSVSLFKSELMADSLAAKRVELAIVTFGGTIHTATDFTTAEQFSPPQLSANGGTPMGAAIIRAIELVTE